MRTPDILYSSASRIEPVHFSPRTATSEPNAWTLVPNPYGHEDFEANLHAPGGETPAMTLTISKRGLAADMVAHVWTQHGKLVEAVATADYPRARGRQWDRWTTGVLAGHDELETPKPDLLLVGALDREQAGLRARKEKLHPVAEAVRDLLHARVQLASMNGSTPPPELLPPTAYADPTALVGMAVLELAQRHDNYSFANN